MYRNTEEKLKYFCIARVRSLYKLVKLLLINFLVLL